MTTIRPLGNILLVLRSEAAEVSPGGLYIPESAKKKPHRGTVKAAGPGRRSETGQLIPTSVAPGDVVLFGADLGREVDVEGTTYVLISEDLVLGTVEGA